MASFLRTTAFVLVGLVVAVHLGPYVLPEQTFWGALTDPKLVQTTLAIAGVMLVISLIMEILHPVGKKIRGSRCVRCGKPIPKGDFYCADHLKDVVSEYRDQNR